MSYIWFNMVLESLGKRINFESISNIYGNSFCKEPQKIVLAANPLLKNGGRDTHSGAAVMGLAGNIAHIKVKKSEVDINKLFAGDKSDNSWAKDFILGDD